MRKDDERGRKSGKAPAGMSGVRRLRLVTIGLPLIAALNGCAALFEAPDVRLVSVRLLGLGLRGGTLEAGIVVFNPNRYPLRSGVLRYDLELGDAGPAGETVWLPLAGGQLDREIEVPAGDSVVVDVPIEFAWDAVGGAIRSLLERGTFDYRVSGDLQLRSPIRRTVPYRRTGTLSLGR